MIKSPHLANRKRYIFFCLTTLASLTILACASKELVQMPPPEPIKSPQGDSFSKMMQENEKKLAEPFVGITEDGKPETELFTAQMTGVSTSPIRSAAKKFLDSLNPDDRPGLVHQINSIRWRKWSNTHRYPRDGKNLGQLSSEQRQLAMELLKSSLSARGLHQSQEIMQLNEHLGDLADNEKEFSSDLYWMNIFGVPSATDPWGWQLDGHHLNINYFVLGDQVVVTPSFFGSEPASWQSGSKKGKRVFDREEDLASQLMNMLTEEQRKKVVLSDKVPENIFTAGFRDNYELRYEGIAYGELTRLQQRKLFELISVYTHRVRKPHAELWVKEIEKHRDRTYFSWMGGTGPTDVFYYRVHSPLILIEFDHQPGLFYRKGKVDRDHIHSVVRTPNGNDYGKDLLRQHYLDHDHGDGKPHQH